MNNNKAYWINVLLLILGISLCHADYSQSLNKYDLLMKNHVENGLVEYIELIARQNQISEFLEESSSVTQAEFNLLSSNDKLTFLINLYNAATIDLIIRNYPLKSIKDLGSFFSSVWKKEFISLFGKTMSLDHIEHNLIRANFKDPRVHFALVCASIGCPPLRSEAYRADKLDQQLADQADVFINKSSNKNHYNSNTNTLYLSPIFKWYEDDFETTGSVISFISQYKNGLNAETSIEYTDYSWLLNDKIKGE
jgi:hypothetical protein